MMPVSTSPVPPVAMPGLPVWLMLKRCAVGDDGLVAFEHDDDAIVRLAAESRRVASSAAASTRRRTFAAVLR